MAKRLLDDMKKVSKGKPIPKKIYVQEKIEPKPRIKIKEKEYHDHHEIESADMPQEKSSRYGIWAVAAISILFLLFAFSYFFSGATVAISPRVEDLDLNQNFSAVKDPPAQSGASGDLPFELVAISGEEDKSVAGGEAMDVALKAEGSVVIYNAFSSAPQPLSIDTRLEGSNGKIYKTKSKTIVPGMNGNVPGSVEIGIYATEAGTAYNSAPLDFKIFGFKGTPKYAKFYARSKGEIAGGFVGKMRRVSDSDKAALLPELTSGLEAKLMKQATGQIPPGFILFKDAAFLNIDEENFSSTGSASDDAEIPVNIKGTLYGILFEEKSLTKKIIQKAFPGEEGNDIYIQNIKDLAFSMSMPADLSGLGDVKNINFNLSGKSKAVWRIDEDKLIADIVGKKKSQFNQILAQSPNILSANLSLRPFWTRSLPDKKDDIKVVVTYPQ